MAPLFHRLALRFAPTPAATVAVLAACLLAASSAQGSNSSTDIKIGGPTAPPTQAPASSTPEITVPTSNLDKYMPQAGAFQTASEQAIFLELYQSLYGPFGKYNPDRDKLLRETALAIDDCIKGTDCGQDKQVKVMKALMQYNVGQETRRMALQNSSNREKMRSLEDPTPVKGGGTLLDPQALDKSLSQGLTFSHEKDSKNRPVQVKTRGTLARAATGRLDPYFQLDVNEVRMASVGGVNGTEREILGPAFLKEYRGFIDNYGNTMLRQNDSRFARFKPVRGNKGYVFDEQGNRIMIDDTRLQTVAREQQSKGIRDTVEKFKESLTPVEGGQMQADGTIGLKISGLRSKDIGFNDDTVAIIPAQKKELNLQPEEGKTVNDPLTGLPRARAIAMDINRMFKETGDKGLAELASQRGRDPASKSYDTAELSYNPAEFGKFLDEIWPTPERREQIRNEPPPPEPVPEPTLPDVQADPAGPQQPPADDTPTTLIPPDARGPAPRE